MTEQLSPDSIVASLPAFATDGRLIVAFSGGLDSTVLLHILHRHWPGRYRLHAVHVNHGLQAHAPAWAEHCRAQCAAWAIPFEVRQVSVDSTYGGLEAAARCARYAALFAVMAERDVLATAQHADDQAETVLLQLLRGAGPKGLAAMPTLARRTAGGRTRRVVRPLLACQREQILRYARRHGLSWIEDPSNADQRRSRNYLRHTLIPLMRARWPQMTRSLSRSAGLCADAAALIDELAAQDLAKVRTAGAESLSVRALRALSPSRARNALRYWLSLLGLPTPTQAHMKAIEQELLRAAPDACPRVAWSRVELRRYRNAVFAMPTLPPAPGPQMRLSWDPTLNAGLELPPGCGQLAARRVYGRGLRADAEPLTVGFRAGGERLRTHRNGPCKLVKQLFQEAGVPPWVRTRMPFLYAGAELVAVADLWVSAAWQACRDEPGWALSWHGAPRGCPGRRDDVAAG